MTNRMSNERIAELAEMQPGTPGPWHIHASERYGDRCTEYYHEVWDENLNVICEEVTRAHNDGGSKNMRLIAASPEAFAALRQTRADLAQAEATLAERDAEIERLKADLENGSFYQEKDIDAMQAEIARLREALGAILHTNHGCFYDSGPPRYVEIARAALSMDDSHDR